MDLAAKGWSSFKVDQGHGQPGDLATGLSPGFSSPVFWIALSLNVIFLVIMRWSTIYGCRKCDVLIFVPLNTTANIILSVAAGMICLAEYKSVKSWPGLIAAGLSMLTGIFMLVTGPADTVGGGGNLGESTATSPKEDMETHTSHSQGDRSCVNRALFHVVSSHVSYTPPHKQKRNLDGLYPQRQLLFTGLLCCQ